MPRHTVSAYSPHEIVEAARKARSKNHLADILGVGKATLKTHLKKHPGLDEQVKAVLGNGGENTGGRRPKREPHGTGITRTSTASGDTIESRSTRIKTLEELLEAADVDLEVWSVKDYTVNSWEQNSVEEGIVPLFQIKARLERRKEVIELHAIRDGVVEAMRSYSPRPSPRPVKRRETGRLLEIEVPDLHLGKMAHHEETGSDYDGKIATHAFRYAFYDLLERGRDMKVEDIVFPVGNDLLHVDSEEATTTNGTRQDTDGRLHKSVQRATELMVEAIDAMLSVANVVTLPIVAGNHSRQAEWFLGQIIRAWYRNEPRLVVHDSPAPRKYYRHGSVLLGFTHGDGVKAADLPLLMAQEVPEDWAVTKYRSWSTGHLHQRKSTKFGSVIEDKGVEVRISPSLSATDAWHARMGYVGNLRAAEAHVYCEDAGRIATFPSTLPEDYMSEAS